MLNALFFKGKIPFLKPARKILTYLPLVSLLVFTQYIDYRLFGKWGWWLLTFILFIRPLSDILPKLQILRTLTTLRKELGVMAGYFIIAHGIGYFYQKSYPVFGSFFNTQFWNFSNKFGWGMVGLVLAAIITGISNKWGIRTLKKYWKPVQRLTYLLFLTSAVHLYLAGYQRNLVIGITVSLIILWFLAYQKRVLWK